MKSHQPFYDSSSGAKVIISFESSKCIINYSLAFFISRFVALSSFCSSSIRSFSCSWVGSISLIRMLLYVATPIGVVIPRKDHCTSVLSISEQIRRPIVGLSSGAFNRHILLNSLYLYPWYCFKCFYSSKHVRGFFKTVALSIWLISLGLIFFIARDNAILQKQQNINRYVHAYFRDNAEVMMEIEGIDLMFSNQEVSPMSVKEYREYIKERKKEAKGSKHK